MLHVSAFRCWATERPPHLSHKFIPGEMGGERGAGCTVQISRKRQTRYTSTGYYMEVPCVQKLFNKKSRLELYTIFHQQLTDNESIAWAGNTRAPRTPHTYTEKSRHPGCCSCNLYNTGTLFLKSMFYI
jgi:hypothetical protein